jgi:hypothetical protein
VITRTRIYGHGSATMPGIALGRVSVDLNALAVLCYGWRNPARTERELSTAARRWYSPLLRWTRPMARVA